MNYETIVSKMKEYYRSVCTDLVKGHLAVQFNVTGDGHGIFYLERSDSLLKVEPYDYHDHDLCITADSSVFLRIAEHTLTFEEAAKSSLCSITGYRTEEFFSIQPAVIGSDPVSCQCQEAVSTVPDAKEIMPAPVEPEEIPSGMPDQEINKTSSASPAATAPTPKKQKKLSRKKRKAEKAKNSKII